MVLLRKPMWSVATLASVAAGVAAAIIAAAGRQSGHCAKGHVMDAGYAVGFVALALAPALVVLLAGRLARRPGEEISLPTAAALCLSAILVFACVMIALSGSSCLN